MRNLVKIGQEISEKKTSTDYMILCKFIAQGQGQITPGGQKLYIFNLTLQVLG